MPADTFIARGGQRQYAVIVFSASARLVVVDSAWRRSATRISTGSRGFLVLNDFIARDVQQQEMQSGFGQHFRKLGGAGALGTCRSGWRLVVASVLIADHLIDSSKSKDRCRECKEVQCIGRREIDD